MGNDMDLLKDMGMGSVIKEGILYEESTDPFKCFSQKSIDRLVESNLIEEYRIGSCGECKEDITTERFEEVKLYDTYFGLKYEKTKNMKMLMQMTSLENILDFKFKCTNCKHEIMIERKEDANKFFNKTVYKKDIGVLKERTA